MREGGGAQAKLLQFSAGIRVSQWQPLQVDDFPPRVFWCCLTKTNIDVYFTPSDDEWQQKKIFYFDREELGNNPQEEGRKLVNIPEETIQSFFGY